MNFVVIIATVLLILLFGRTEGQLQVIGVTPGSGILTPNVSYELTKISQKRRVPHSNVELERNPAYATSLCVNP